jgi:hypothetical protein
VLEDVVQRMFAVCGHGVNGGQIPKQT